MHNAECVISDSRKEQIPVLIMALSSSIGLFVFLLLIPSYM